MAEAGAKNSTSDEIWFSDGVALLASHCGSAEFAEQLLVGGLENDRVPWSHMRSDGTLVKNDTTFWHCKKVHRDINRVENRAWYSPLVASDGLDDVPEPVFAIKVSRAATLALLPSQPQKRKRPKGHGRPREYDHAAIARVTEDYISENGLPKTQALLREKVENGCREESISVPGDTLLKKITSPIWRHHRKSRKVAN